MFKPILRISEKITTSKTAQNAAIAALLSCRYRPVIVPLPFRSRCRYRSPHRKARKALIFDGPVYSTCGPEMPYFRS